MDDPQSASGFRLAELSHCSPADMVSSALETFLTGELAGVRYHNFLTQAQAVSYAKAAYDFPFRRYDTAPEVGVIGLALVDLPVVNAYLARAAMYHRPENFFAASAELLQFVMAFLTTATKRKVEVLTLDGCPCHAGNFRLLTHGAGIHLDFLPHDCSTLRDMPVEFQGSFVLHLETPGVGGETTVYKKRGTAADKNDPLYKDSKWKYSTAVVDGVESVTVPAVTTDLVFLPTQFFHSVAPCVENKQERISFSAFIIKMRGDETLYLYS